MEVFFLRGPQGPLFSVYHPATGHHRPARLGLVYAPPFAEEMNRARRMAALQARRLAGLGVDVLLLDPFGTGDSAGDFGDARWETWREDVKVAATWLEERTAGKVGLWGLRLGAMLAADVAAEDPGRFTRLVLWQPVLSGDRYLMQFLRLRLASALTQGGARESTKDLRARLAGGEALEIAGYELSPALADALARRSLPDLLARLDLSRLDWLELASGDETALSPATRQLVAALEQQGRRLAPTAVHGEPFWAIQEITLAPDLLGATDGLFAG